MIYNAVGVKTEPDLGHIAFFNNGIQGSGREFTEGLLWRQNAKALLEWLRHRFVRARETESVPGFGSFCRLAVSNPILKICGMGLTFAPRLFIRQPNLWLTDGLSRRLWGLPSFPFFYGDLLHIFPFYTNSGDQFFSPVNGVFVNVLDHETSRSLGLIKALLPRSNRIGRESQKIGEQRLGDSENLSGFNDPGG